MKYYNEKIHKMINFNDVIQENIKEHNLNWQKFLIIHTEY